MRSRVLTLVALALVAGTSLSACTSRLVPVEGPLEPELIVYTSAPKDLQDVWTAEWQKINPNVKLNWVSPGGTEVMLKKIKEEAADPKADIMLSGSTAEYNQAIKDGLLQPFQGLQDVPETVDLGGQKLRLRHPGNMYVLFTIQFNVIGINTKRLQELGVPAPKAFTDLANPQYRKLMVMSKPARSSLAYTFALTTYQVFGPEKVWPFWDSLQPNIGLHSDSSGALGTLLAKGEFPIALVGSRAIWRDKEQGFPVEAVYPIDGTSVFDSGVAMVKGARHPRAAQKFIEFLVSREMQAAQTEIWYPPVRPGVQARKPGISLEELQKAIPRLVLIDEAMADKARDEIMKKFEDYTRTK